jgi:sigma-B regulation protein RsbU (phosphoserine phosphatase)
MVRHHLSLAPDLAEVSRMTAWAEACCGGAGLDDLAFKLVLALEEAVANVVNHAFVGVAPPHRIEVVLDTGDGQVVAEVIDNGRAFDPSTAPEPDLSLPLAERDPGGLGILLIHRMMDRVEYRRSDGKNCLRLEKSRTD